MGESDPGGEANMGGRRPWGGSGYFDVPIAATAAAAAARHRSRCQGERSTAVCATARSWRFVYKKGEGQRTSDREVMTI